VLGRLSSNFDKFFSSDKWDVPVFVSVPLSCPIQLFNEDISVIDAAEGGAPSDLIIVTNVDRWRAGDGLANHVVLSTVQSDLIKGAWQSQEQMGIIAEEGFFVLCPLSRNDPCTATLTCSFVELFGCGDGLVFVLWGIWEELVHALWACIAEGQIEVRREHAVEFSWVIFELSADGTEVEQKFPRKT
tara:strand:- start:1839 stop:2399 length:561 start_codon:yes stop_codon:yes gene_type:complete